MFSRSKGAGKTFVVEALASKLSSMGIPVVAVKHVHHGSPDLLWGKDAERAFSAGALVSIAYGSEYSVIIARTSTGPLELVKSVSGLIGASYALLIEGFRGVKHGVSVFVVKSGEELEGEECKRLSEAGGFIVSLNVDNTMFSKGCRVYRVEELVDEIALRASRFCLGRGAP